MKAKLVKPDWNKDRWHGIVTRSVVVFVLRDGNPKKIRDFAATLDTGGMGIGWYPRAQFVHIDVRPMPSYRWIDGARPNPNSPDKRPPKGWKRKKLQS